MQLFRRSFTGKARASHLAPNIISFNKGKLATHRSVHNYSGHRDRRLLFLSLGLVSSTCFFVQSVDHSQSGCESSSSGSGSSNEKVMSRFAKALRPDQIESDIEERKQRAKPWNSYHIAKNIPMCLLYPETTEEVSEIMKICYAMNVPVVAYGGGTSLEGHTLPVTVSGKSDPVSLDFSRMNAVLEFNEGDLDVTVQVRLEHIKCTTDENSSLK